MQIFVAALMDSRLMFRILLIYYVLLFILCLIIAKIERMLIMMTVDKKKKRENRKVINLFLFLFAWVIFSLLTLHCVSG